MSSSQLHNIDAASSAPTKRRCLLFIAIGITLLVHGMAALSLWRIGNHRLSIQPPRPLEVALITPPPTPVTIPEPVAGVAPLASEEPSTPPVIDAPAPAPAVAKPKPPLKKQLVVKALAPSKREESVATSEAPAVAMSAPNATLVAMAAPIDPPLAAPLFDAAYLNNPAPEYPRAARRLHLQGKVIVRVLVSAAGTAERVGVAQSSGAEMLDKAALDAVREWTFVPARQGSRAVVGEVDVPINFNLR